MTKELEEKFIKDFPELFIDMYGRPQETCLAFGIECGDGWFFPIYDLSKEINDLCKDIKPYPVRVSQVKEKFGGLRFYYDILIDDNDLDNKINDLINKAEDECDETCENCGSKEDVTKKGSWIKTLCKKCRDKKE